MLSGKAHKFSIGLSGTLLNRYFDRICPYGRKDVPTYPDVQPCLTSLRGNASRTGSEAVYLATPGREVSALAQMRKLSPAVTQSRACSRLSPVAARMAATQASASW